MVSPQSVWDGVLRRLGAELPDFVLEAWVRPLAPEPDGAGLRLLANSGFHCERVRQLYLDKIRACAEQEAGHPLPVTVEVGAPQPAQSAAPQAASAANGAGVARTVRPPRTGMAAAPAATQQQRSLPYSFASFVVGPANALAREACYALAQGRQLDVSPLFLSGATGMGKTHLAFALAGEARRRAGKRVRHVSAEAFTTQFLGSLRARTTSRFKRCFRQECDLLVIEDVQFLRGKEATQLELFHTIECLRAVGAGIALTGDRLPREISDLDPRLRSQMAAGLVAELEPPDARLRREILRAKASAGGVRIPDDCLDRLVEVVRGSVRDVEGVLIQLVQTALLLKQPIDLGLTETALRKVVDGAERGRALLPREVVATVASFYGTTPEAMASRSRRRDVLVPRQLAMYLCRRYTEASVHEIGRALGREHPAVRNAVEVVERAILERAPLRYRVEELASRLDALAEQPAARGALRSSGSAP